MAVADSSVFLKLIQFLPQFVGCRATQLEPTCASCQIIFLRAQTFSTADRSQSESDRLQTNKMLALIISRFAFDPDAPGQMQNASGRGAHDQLGLQLCHALTSRGATTFDHAEQRADAG